MLGVERSESKSAARNGRHGRRLAPLRLFGRRRLDRGLRSTARGGFAGLHCAAAEKRARQSIWRLLVADGAVDGRGLRERGAQSRAHLSVFRTAGDGALEG